MNDKLMALAVHAKNKNTYSKRRDRERMLRIERAIHFEKTEKRLLQA